MPFMRGRQRRNSRPYEPARQRPGPFEYRAELAVPLGPAEASALVEMLRTVDRIVRTASHPTSPGFADDLADVLLTDAGTASALGHQTVPLLVRHLDEVDHAVRNVEQHAPDSPDLAPFRCMRDKLRALSGAARIKGWTATAQHVGGFGALANCVWTDDAPFAAQASLPHLIDAPDRSQR